MGSLKNPLTPSGLGLIAGLAALLCLMCPLADATDSPSTTIQQEPAALPSLAPIVGLNKTSKIISVLDRLLNRNQSQNRVVNGVSSPNGAANGATPRPAVRPIFGFVPDVSAGVDTILNGVATGNLEQILTGSFIFSPNRVQTIANGVINRVFGGQSISTVNRPGAPASSNAGAQQVAPSSGAASNADLVQAINDIRLQQQQQQQQTQQQNLLPPSPPRRLLPSFSFPSTSAPLVQQTQQPIVAPTQPQGTGQNNSTGLGNIINSVLGGLGGIFG